MATDRNKIVENYVLEELRLVNPDDSTFLNYRAEIWTAKHRVLKKNFTMRRLKYHGSAKQSQKGKGSSSAKEEWDYQNVVRETNLLKRLNVQSAPKCHKLIKTSNNIYIIYDDFPPLALKDHIAKYTPSRQQKLQIMLQIAKTLQYFHNCKIVMLSLSLSNIYPQEKKPIFFADWSLAHTLEEDDKVDATFLNNKFEFIAKQVLTQGTYSTSSDIFSIGKIFSKIHHSGYLSEPSAIDNRMQTVINSMISDKQQNRPSLSDVIKAIEDCYNKCPSGRSSQKSQDNEPQSATLKLKTGFKIKHSLSSPTEEDGKINYLMLSQKKNAEEPESIRVSKGQKSCKNIPLDISKSFKSLRTSDGMQVSKRTESRTSLELNSISVLRYSRKNKSKQYDQAIKRVSKARNMSFFLLQLSQFVIKLWICPELGFILLKYATLTLNSALQEWKNDNWDGQKSQLLVEVLKGQKQKFQANLTVLRDGLKQFDNDDNMKKQLDHLDQISERFLKQKIVQFSKQIVLYCQKYLNDKNSISKLVDCLFKTYMILKKIEQGSYQRFWERIYNAQQVYLGSQKYLKEEKTLGHRYLKSRIAQILKGK